MARGRPNPPCVGAPGRRDGWRPSRFVRGPTYWTCNGSLRARCILFALLSDAEPYTGSNEELLQQHKSAPIPEPTLQPEVPREVGAFVTRLLAKRPWHRYEFAADARRVWRRFAPDPAKSATGTPLP